MRPILGSIAMLWLTLAGQAAEPAFEAASIRPATPLGPMGQRTDRKGGPGTSDPGMYRCTNCPIAWVLDEAYDLQTFEYVGPPWVQDVRFDFAAKIPPGTSKPEFRGMLRNLLAERFK